ncbi:MAG: hypothetical protein P9L99_14475 [Candidatus Lernaella stagnicola]|nr:hypothetical protein [Candidatus Lernaella stagnicola]
MSRGITRNKLTRTCLAALIVVLMAAAIVTAADDEDSDEDASQNALRKALGYNPNEAKDPTPQVAPVVVPEMDIKPPPEEERATYLRANMERIQAETSKLQALKQEIEKELEELKKVRAEIDQRLAKEDAETAAKIQKLIKIYDKMPIEKLAGVLALHPEDLRIKLLYHMKEKRVSELLANMEPAAAAKISQQLLNKKTK